MTKFQLLHLKLTKYPPEVRTAIIKGLLNAAKKKIVASKENSILKKSIQNKIDEDWFNTEYGTLYWNKNQTKGDI